MLALPRCGKTGSPARARSLGISLPGTAACQELFNAAAAGGGSAWDHSGLVRALERLAKHEIGENLRLPAAAE